MGLPMGRSQGCWNLPTGLPSAHWEMWTLKLAWKQHQQALTAKKRASMKTHQSITHTAHRSVPYHGPGQALKTWHSAMWASCPGVEHTMEQGSAKPKYDQIEPS